VNEPVQSEPKLVEPIWAFVRVIIYIFLVVVGMLGSGNVISQNFPELVTSMGLYGQCVSEIVMLTIGAVLAAIFTRNELKSFVDDIGLFRNRAIPEVIVGFSIGMIIVGTMFGVMYLCGGYSVTKVNWPIDFVPALVLYFFAGLTEEFLFRGYIFRTFEKSGGTIYAIIFSSLCFGFAHFFNMPEDASLGYKTYACLILSFEAGLPLSGAFLLTRSLWLAVGFHWAWNFLEGTVFGVAVSGTDAGPAIFTAHMTGNQYISGGVFGPEAGLPFFTVGVLTGLGMIFLALKQRKWSLTAGTDIGPISRTDL
jgi:membrane protease YdiL (CAAX protease family)